MCACKCVFKYLCTCVHVESRFCLGVISQEVSMLSIYLIEVGFLINWGRAWDLTSRLGWMANKSCGSACFCFPSTRITRTLPHSGFSPWVLDQAQVLMLAQDSLPPSHLPQLPYCVTVKGTLRLGNWLRNRLFKIQYILVESRLPNHSVEECSLLYHYH